MHSYVAIANLVEEQQNDHVVRIARFAIDALNAAQVLKSMSKFRLKWFLAFRQVYYVLHEGHTINMVVMALVNGLDGTSLCP